MCQPPSLYVSLLLFKLATPRRVRLPPSRARGCCQPASHRAKPLASILTTAPHLFSISASMRAPMSPMVVSFRLDTVFLDGSGRLLEMAFFRAAK
jgi:hypothetical protein